MEGIGSWFEAPICECPFLFVWGCLDVVSSFHDILGWRKELVMSYVGFHTAVLLNQQPLILFSDLLLFNNLQQIDIYKIDSVVFGEHLVVYSIIVSCWKCISLHWCDFEVLY